MSGRISLFCESIVPFLWVPIVKEYDAYHFKLQARLAFILEFRPVNLRSANGVRRSGKRIGGGWLGLLPLTPSYQPRLAKVNAPNQRKQRPSKKAHC